MEQSDHIVQDGFCLFWKSWLSNWKSSPMTIDSVQYTCVAQYMMSMKARLFGDQETLHKIMATTDPKEQKKLGRSVANFNDGQWYEVAFDVVVRGTVEKYRQNPQLLILLQQCGDVEFVEASPMDKVWGIGVDAHHSNALRKTKWHGKNLLGQAINKAKNLIEQLEVAGITPGGGVDKIWPEGMQQKFLIGLDQV